MAFLEAMAMGKCVVANDDATMNEYIKDGENGILFSCDVLKPVSEVVISRARANIVDSAPKLRAKWLRDAAAIHDLLFGQQTCDPSFVDRLKIAFSFPLFIVEGMLQIFAKGIRSF